MRRARGQWGVALIVAASIALAGCAPSSPVVDSDALSGLQDQVLSVSVAVSEQDWAAASADLDGLERAVATAVEQGAIDGARADGIRAAIDLLRTDIAEELAAQQEQPTESPTPGKPGNGNGNDKGPDKKP